MSRRQTLPQKIGSELVPKSVPKMSVMQNIPRALVLLACVAFFYPSVAMAKKPRFSRIQSKLYSKARKAYDAGEYDKSIKLLKKANNISPYNVLYFAIGRAHFKQKQCKQAQRNYDKALSAPILVDNLGPKIQEAVKELEKTCDGQLVIRCKSPKTQVSINDQPATDCPTQPIALPAGTHKMEARLGKQLLRATFLIKGTKTHTESVPFEQEITVIKPTQPAPKKTPANTQLGYVALIGGATLLVTAVGMDWLWVGSTLEHYNDQRKNYAELSDVRDAQSTYQLSRVVTLTTGGLSVAALAFGGIWLFMQPNETPQTIVSPTISSDGAGFTWSVRW